MQADHLSQPTTTDENRRVNRLFTKSFPYGDKHNKQNQRVYAGIKSTSLYRAYTPPIYRLRRLRSP